MIDSAYAVLTSVWNALLTFSEASYPQKVVMLAFVTLTLAISVAVVAKIIQVVRERYFRIRENLSGLLGW